MKRYVVSKLADKDLDDIWVHVATEKNAVVADGLIDEIVATFKLAAFFPGGGQDRSELGSGLRSLPCGNYLVFYRNARGVVRVVRVIHGARKLERIFRRRRPPKH